MKVQLVVEYTNMETKHTLINIMNEEYNQMKKDKRLLDKLCTFIDSDLTINDIYIEYENERIYLDETKKEFSNND